MTDEQDRAAERRRYFAFLDTRIPELHAQGKKIHITRTPKGEAEQRQVTPGPFAGRLARRQADKEWAEHRDG
jgi:hypothetical protein